MVALAEKFTREANSSKTRTSQNRHRGNSSSPTVFLQPKNRGPATNNRILSQKYLDDKTSWYYYGFRYYSPELGRWPSRDPIGKDGGLNVYGFVENSSVDVVDYVGFLPASFPPLSWWIENTIPTFDPPSAEEWVLARQRAWLTIVPIDEGDTPVVDGSPCSSLGTSRRWLVQTGYRMENLGGDSYPRPIVLRQIRYLVRVHKFDVYHARCQCDIPLWIGGTLRWRVWKQDIGEEHIAGYLTMVRFYLNISYSFDPEEPRPGPIVASY